ncbi:MAG: PUA domain-containing protein [Halobacteriales archaeon]
MDDETRLRAVADYQFGKPAGDVLFEGDLEVHRTSRGRVSQVFADGDRLATLKTTGRLTLGFEGGRRLHEATEPPWMRVEVGDESLPYVRDGRNAFAKFVRRVDDGVRAGDEVLVTGPGDVYVKPGRAELSAVEMEDFDVGMAVYVRR